MLDILFQHFSINFIPVVVAALLVFQVARLYVKQWQARRAAAALGATPLPVGIPGPLGFGFFYESMRRHKQNASLEMWEDIFQRNGGSAVGNYTAEQYVLGNKRLIMTADPENVKAALATDFGSWGKGKQLYENFRFFLGDGILSTDGEKWHAARGLMRPLFIKDRVADLDLFEERVQKLVPMLGNGEVREVDDLIFRFTLDTISAFLLGERVGALEDSSNAFTTAFNEVQRVQSQIMRAGPLNWTVPRSSYLANIKVTEAYMEPYITRAVELAKREKLDQVEDTHLTLLHNLAFHTSDRKTIRDQLMSVLFAGSDTTASAMTWVIYELSRHPEVVTKLRHHIYEVLGTSDWNRRPTYDELKSMKFLQHVINETLRLYATMPFATRQAQKDTTLPRGGGPDGLSPIGVQKHTVVLYSALLMHRRRDLYPPLSADYPWDARTWAPDRWEVWQPKSWQLIPFSGGPRICIGQNFAVTELAYSITRLVQMFDKFVDYNLDDAGFPKKNPVLKYGIVVTAAEGVKVGFVRKSE